MDLPRDGSVVMFMLVRSTAGRPTGYPMTGLFRDGVLRITTYRKAAKARYLLADGRVCCVVPDPERPGVGVRLVGRAVPAEASGFAASTRSNSAAIDVPDEVRATVRDRLESDKRMVFRIDVERIEPIGADAVSKVEISMTGVEVDAFLARCPQMVVGGLDADGWPTGTLAASSYVDGALALEFAEDAPLLGDVCCVADEHASYFEIQGVIVHGRAVAVAGVARRALVAIERIVSFDFGRLRQT